MGTKLEELRRGCFAAAMDDEPMFVLLARDASAPNLARAWAEQREQDIERGLKPRSDMEKVVEARDCALFMEAWRRANDGEWRKGLFARQEQLTDAVAVGMSEHRTHGSDSAIDDELSPEDAATAEGDERRQREAE